jgi:adenine-specific DNA methylase
MEGKIGHRIYAAAVPVGNRKGKSYFNTNDEDEAAFEAAALKWQELINKGEVTELYETFPYHDSRAFTGGLYGVLTWGDMFSARQKLSVHTLSEILEDYAQVLAKRNIQAEVITDTITLLSTRHK